MKFKFKNTSSDISIENVKERLNTSPKVNAAPTINPLPEICVDFYYTDSIPGDGKALKIM